MTRFLNCAWPIDHPEILAIALDVILRPARRAHYSTVVLVLADAAIDNIFAHLTANRHVLVKGPLAQPPAGSDDVTQQSFSAAISATNVSDENYCQEPEHS